MSINNKIHTNKNRGLLLYILLIIIFFSLSLISYGEDKGVIQSGETTSGSISNPSTNDSFQFTGNAGDFIVINAVKTSGELNTGIILNSPTGVEEDKTFSGDQIIRILSETGTYNIQILDYYQENSGIYKITFQKIPGTLSYAGDLDGEVITSGQTIGGTINAASDMDVFQFSGSAGDSVVINATKTSGKLNTGIDLISPAGIEEDKTYSGDQITRVLSETGTYSILISDFYLENTGKYNITLNPKSKVNTALSLKINPTSIKVGQRTKLIAKLYRSKNKKAIKNKLIYFQVKKGKRWKVFKKKLTNSTGQAAIYVRPRSSVSYSVVFKEDSDYKRGSTSLGLTKTANTISKTIVRIETFISIYEVPEIFYEGSNVKLSVDLYSWPKGRAVTGKSILFQVNYGGRWRSIRQTRTDIKGKTSIIVRPRIGYTYRALFHGDKKYKKSSNKTPIVVRYR